MSFRDGEIDLVCRDYICAQDYSDLHKAMTENRRWLAVCEHGHDVEIAGRVTKKWAIKQGQKLAGRRKELEYLYRAEQPKRPVEKILEDLGL